MRLLSAQDILRIWELGQHQPDWYRSLLMLSAAFPHVPQQELAAVSIGRRNATLFALRNCLLGTQVNAFAHCPQCAEKLEFGVNATDLCDTNPIAPIAPEFSLTVHGFQLRFRALTSVDLAEVSRCGDHAIARQRLIERCVLQATLGEGEAIAAAALPESVITALAEALAECDPASTFRFSLSCPACQHEWRDEFDIGAFFWLELTMQARRLLNEVHTLANAYGWREADILAMSAFRRQAYLEGVL